MLKNFSLLLVITGMSYGFTLYILGNVLIGLAYYFTSLPEDTLPWLAEVLYFTSVLTGAAIAARRAGGKGLYYGLAIAFLFFFLMWGLSAAVLPFEALSSPSIQKLALALAAGILGGVLGVFMAS